MKVKAETVKQLLIDEIHSCRVVRNKWWQGFGIRMLSDGWMYNLSGLQAVKLKLKSGAQVRLGTDEPNYLLQAIDHVIALKDTSQR